MSYDTSYSPSIWVSQKWYDTDTSVSSYVPGGQSSLIREYMIRTNNQATLSEDDVILAVLSATTQVVSGLYRRDITTTRISRTVYEASVTWESFKPVGETILRFSTAGQRVPVSAAVQHINSYDAAGVASDVGEYSGIIGLGKNGRFGEVKKVDTVGRNLTFNIDMTFTSGTITTSYINTLYGLTGTVNNATFQGFASGEVLFLGADASDSDVDNDSISFAFSCAPNISNGVVGNDNTGAGGITYSKLGHDFLWAEYEGEEDSLPDKVGQDNTMRKLSKIHIERVYQFADFSLLGI